ncbi:hypothetical protein NPIL_518301, partial [Nephila pilipes]
FTVAVSYFMLRICSRLALAALTISIAFSEPKLFSRSSRSCNPLSLISRTRQSRINPFSCSANSHVDDRVLRCVT